MRSSLFAILGAAGIAAASLNNCAANNCYRAVVASRFPDRPTKADCSSYLATTVTPSAVTVTYYANATQSSPVSVTAPASTHEMPSYATACSKDGQYSSACSCIGVTGYTVTADIPTVTTTVGGSSSVSFSSQSATISSSSAARTSTTSSLSNSTSSSTSTIGSSSSILSTSTVRSSSSSLSTSTVRSSSISSAASSSTSVSSTRTSSSSSVQSSSTVLACAGPTPTFKLRALGGTFDGQYVKLATNTGSQLANLQSSLSAATPFQLDTSGHLVWPNNPQNGYVLGEQTSSKTTLGRIYFNTQSAITAGGYQLINCVIDPATLYLTCICPGAGGNSILQQNAGVLWLGNTLGYEALTLKAVCLS